MWWLHISLWSRRPIEQIISDLNNRITPKKEWPLELAISSKEKIFNILSWITWDKNNN